MVAAEVMLRWRLRIGPVEVAVAVDTSGGGTDMSGYGRRKKLGFHLRFSGGEHLYIGRGS